MLFEKRKKYWKEILKGLKKLYLFLDLLKKPDFLDALCVLKLMTAYLK